ncbi:MAG: hypothetical protein FWH48_03655 [Oscillospiraceae bacterium]|nr:hypothetical protein [Oscillospiraceae bacterium]
MKNKGAYVSMLLMTIVILLQGCTTFTVPTGIWKCDDLGIMIDFDQDEIKWGSITGKGTITRGGETKEIICGMDPIGSANFLYVDDIDKHPSERSYIYRGTFRHIDESTMIFTTGKDKEKYTFEKQASEVEDTTTGDGEIP